MIVSKTKGRRRYPTAITNDNPSFARLYSKSIDNHIDNDDDDDDDDDDDEEEEEEEINKEGSGILYNDFDDFFPLVGSNEDDENNNMDLSSLSSSSLFSSDLSNVLNRERNAERLRDARLAKNWNTGNWAVRGFRLDGRKTDSYYDDENENVEDQTKLTSQQQQQQQSLTNKLNKDPMDVILENSDGDGDGDEDGNNGSVVADDRIDVCRIVFDNSVVTSTQSSPSSSTEHHHLANDLIAVGRTDGSVCIVKLGTEYLGQFTSVPNVVQAQGSWFQNNHNKTDDEKDDNNDEQDLPSSSSTLTIQSQFVRTDKLYQQQQQPYEDPFDEIYGSQQPPMDPSMDNPSSSSPLSEKQIPKTPFEVLHQFQAHDSSPITALLLDDDTIYTAAGSDGTIKVWSIPNNDDQKVQPSHICSGVHTSKIVTLLTLSSSAHHYQGTDHDLLFSASEDGTIALWDISSGCDLVHQCRIPTHQSSSSQSPIILCADVDVSSTPTSTTPSILSSSSKNQQGQQPFGVGHIIYLGLNTGHVMAYAVQDIIGPASEGLDQCILPSCQFLASDQGPITAIKCAGPGTTTKTTSLQRQQQQQQQETTMLITGGEDGTVKQWEMFSRLIQPSSSSNKESSSSNNNNSNNKKYVKMEHWPRLSTQRMKRRAHTFIPTHDGPITALNAMDCPSKILSTSKDGSIRIWDPYSGKELYRMDGFTSSIQSPCLDGKLSSMLITDGMEDYVCVHDFDINAIVETHNNEEEEDDEG